ncbi:MAG: hypothetical protein WCD89_10105 [Anaerocolumna sp.]
MDMFIQERINILIASFHKNQTYNSEKEQILQAENFIENFPGKEKELIENYLTSLYINLLYKKLFCISMDLWILLKM